MHADAISLITHSATVKQHIFDICTAEFYDLDSKFNTKKFMVMRVRQQTCMSVYASDIGYGAYLPQAYARETRYFGVVLKSERYFTTSIREVKLKFYKNVNSHHSAIAFKTVCLITCKHTCPRHGHGLVF